MQITRRLHVIVTTTVVETGVISGVISVVTDVVYGVFDEQTPQQTSTGTWRWEIA